MAEADKGYTKPDKKFYQKWMSNSDISEIVEKMQAPPALVAESKKYASGEEEDDSFIEFEEFLKIRFIPQDEIPFTDEEVIAFCESTEVESEKAVASLNEQEENAPQENTEETGGTGNQEEVTSEINQVTDNIGESHTDSDSNNPAINELVESVSEDQEKFDAGKQPSSEENAIDLAGKETSDYNSSAETGLSSAPDMNSQHYSISSDCGAEDSFAHQSSLGDTMFVKREVYSPVRYATPPAFDDMMDLSEITFLYECPRGGLPPATIPQIHEPPIIIPLQTSNVSAFQPPNVTPFQPSNVSAFQPPASMFEPANEMHHHEIPFEAQAPPPPKKFRALRPRPARRHFEAPQEHVWPTMAASSNGGNSNQIAVTIPNKCLMPGGQPQAPQVTYMAPSPSTYKPRGRQPRAHENSLPQVAFRLPQPRKQLRPAPQYLQNIVPSIGHMNGGVVVAQKPSPLSIRTSTRKDPITGKPVAVTEYFDEELLKKYGLSPANIMSVINQTKAQQQQQPSLNHNHTVVQQQEQHVLHLSPYINVQQAEERVKDIGVAAAQKEIDNFSAIISTGREFAAGTNAPMAIPNHATPTDGMASVMSTEQVPTVSRNRNKKCNCRCCRANMFNRVNGIPQGTGRGGVSTRYPVPLLHLDVNNNIPQGQNGRYNMHQQGVAYLPPLPFNTVPLRPHCSGCYHTRQ